MTREVAIEHWKTLINTVFTAEHKIMPEWEEKLKRCHEMTQKDKSAFCDKYIRAIAIEILKNIPDEELNQIS